MSRWQPDARGRLLQAAIELFTEQGYEATTTAQIAARAGLTRTTLFRQFADKRDILFQGQDALAAAATAGVVKAPAGSSPFQVMRAGVASLCAAHAGDLREAGRLIDPLVARSPELQERAAFKRLSITTALQQAIASRCGDDRQASVLADIGVRAYYEGYAAWMAADGTGSFSDSVDDELAAYGSALLHLGSAEAPPFSS